MNHEPVNNIISVVGNKTIDGLSTIIAQLQAEPKDSIDLQKLQNTENELQDILLMLQFELKQAKDKSNWDLVNTLRPAIHECKYTIDSVRAAIINKIVIGVNSENIQEMQKILADIDEARKTQMQINVAIGLFSFLRKLLSGRILL
ncbi:hypothetical protein NIES2109_37260 [Nostoc sp. HK-01]|uniref:Uncharacterized protein n=2 Tax=Nostocales TaxID=1161 RepID=A0A1Z4GBM7_9CYAN|nr:hypothetical protein [Nostoc cycadae]BAY14915.1 hypothetical protein NIES21_07010 [Anabaenopsis circularis NIES-21]BBD60926.1 hypothetical protein NIES2109_37260 [Nostoc sp. HK-01]GBE91646.1 DnaJ domain containing protein [Nostoc cycadae WK-1]